MRIPESRFPLAHPSVAMRTTERTTAVHAVPIVLAPLTAHIPLTALPATSISQGLQTCTSVQGAFRSVPGISLRGANIDFCVVSQHQCVFNAGYPFPATVQFTHRHLVLPNVYLSNAIVALCNSATNALAGSYPSIASECANVGTYGTQFMSYITDDQVDAVLESTMVVSEVVGYNQYMEHAADIVMPGLEQELTQPCRWWRQIGLRSYKQAR